MQIAANSRRATRKQQNHPRAVPVAKPMDIVNRQHSDSDHESAAQQVQLALAKTLEQVSSSLSSPMMLCMHM